MFYSSLKIDKNGFALQYEIIWWACSLNIIQSNSQNKRQVEKGYKAKTSEQIGRHIFEQSDLGQQGTDGAVIRCRR